MSTMPQLEPENIPIILLPSYYVYVLDGNARSTIIKFQFNYDEEKGVVSMDAYIPENEEVKPVSHGELSLDQLRDLLVHCCENVVRITTLDPVKEIYEHLCQRMHDQLADKHHIAVPGEKIELKNALGRVWDKEAKAQEHLGVFRHIRMTIPTVIEQDKIIEIDMEIPTVMVLQGSGIGHALHRGTAQAEVCTSDTKFSIATIKMPEITEEERHAQFISVRGICTGVAMHHEKSELPLKTLPDLEKGVVSKSDRFSAIIASESISELLEAYRKVLGLPSMVKAKQQRDTQQQVRNRLGRIL